MFLLPESIKKIGSKTTKKCWKHHFPHHKTMGVFFDIQEQITPYYVVLSGRKKFELLLDIMHVLDTYKFKMDWINTKRENMETSIIQTLKDS